MIDLSRPENRPAIRFWHLVVALICRVYHHLKVRTRNVLPRDGAAILVCNHISGLDPLLLQAVSHRLIIWMMAKEYYDLKSLNWFFRIIHAIPVQRSGRDMAAMRAAMRALENGHVLGVFPEGKIETSEELLPFQTGVALMAIKCRVPVYPAYIEGTSRGQDMIPALLHRNVVSLRFGPQVVFDRSDTSREALERATAAIKAAIEALRRDELNLRRQDSL
jgi:1-acyl-sn-glycerol-3-phosphate acyltransferase